MVIGKNQYLLSEKMKEVVEGLDNIELKVNLVNDKYMGKTRKWS